MRVEAFAKINLTLRVRPAESLRPAPAALAGAVDRLGRPASTSSAGERGRLRRRGRRSARRRANLAVAGAGGGAAGPPAGAIRSACVSTSSIPVAAGLGGGSADAAAVLALAAALSAARSPRPGTRSAPTSGPTSPCLLVGGLVRMDGHRGEGHRGRSEAAGFHAGGGGAAVRTGHRRRLPAVGRAGGPAGPADRWPAPAARRCGPTARWSTTSCPAAVDLRPDLGDWMADLARRWAGPVSMSGSGPALFGFFATRAGGGRARRPRWSERRAASGSQSDRGRPARDRRSTSSRSGLLGPLGRPAYTRRDPCGGWCNRQHAGFWSPKYGFESCPPSGHRR